jgi:hypothetical protein
MANFSSIFLLMGKMMAKGGMRIALTKVLMRSVKAAAILRA